MKFHTVNPATEEIIAEYETMENGEVFDIAKRCKETWREWRGIDLSGRTPYFRRLAGVLRDNARDYAELMTSEMGKPVGESLAEVEKCAWTAELYAENAGRWLEEELVKADGKEHRIVFQPLGIILSIMPWNFPFWQALRFGIPTLLAGNASILKHASAVTGCAFAIEDAFKKAAFPEDIFRTVAADHGTVAELVSSPLISGISLTGSTEAGKNITQLAGRNLKKTVLELGGSDPFIVMKDADLDFVTGNAVLGRTINTGQSCIAAKRFIVAEDSAEEFAETFARKMGELVIGDPLDERTVIGPLVNEDAVKEAEDQVADALEKGARLLTGGKRAERKGSFYPPTVLADVTRDMRVFTEEVFAPVAPVITFRETEEAIELANDSEFGLGGSVWTKDLKLGEHIARRIESGSLFVNSIVKSDPRMPFGGIKKSGTGRELSKYGLREFTNIKGLNIYEHG